jgi:mucin-19
MVRGIGNRGSRGFLLASTSALAVGIALAQSAVADPCAEGGDVTISAACTGHAEWTSGDFTVTNTGTIVSGGVAIGVISPLYTVGTLTNDGVLSAPGGGLYSYGTIAAVINHGTISAAIQGTGNAVGILSFGSIGEVVNAGLITIGGGSSALGIGSAGTIGALTNSGLIAVSGAKSAGIELRGTVGRIDNTGVIEVTGSSSAAGIVFDFGEFGELNNTGTIDVGGASAQGVVNAATIGTFSNSGTISAHDGASAVVIANSGSIGTLTNSGLITGAGYAIYNSTLSSSMLLVNAGSVAGNIYNAGALTISGGSNGTVGILTGLNGSIGTFSGSALTFGSGALVINDVIAQGVVVVGTGGTLTNTGTIGTIAGVYVDTEASLDAFINDGVVAAGMGFSNGGSIGTLHNAEGATIDGGYLYAIDNSGSIDDFTNDGVVVSGYIGLNNDGSIAAFTNTGTIRHNGGSGFYGVRNSGSIGTFANSGRIEGRGSVEPGVLNSGTISALTNSGSITGLDGAVGIGNTGNAGTITNTGWIDADSVAIANSGTIGTIVNTGGIASTSDAAIQTSWLLGTLDNSGTLTGRTGVRNYGTIGSLSNGGAISGLVYGLANDGTIGTLSNSGTIVSSVSYSWALSNTGSIGRFTNDGLMEGSNGLWNWGVIDTLVNTGTIRGATSAGIGNSPGGTIGTLSNSGLITGEVFAISNAGSIWIVNSGTIAGDIRNLAGLTLSGGSDGTVGTLTGLNGGLGTVSGSALTFDTGALLLNDVIAEGVNVIGTGGTLINTGTIGSIAGVSIAGSASLDSFTNYGAIAAEMSFENEGSIGTWRNAAGGVIDGRTMSAVVSDGLITTAVNDGFITGRYCGFCNSGTIATFANTGTIQGVATDTAFIALHNINDIGTLTNSGLLIGSGGTYGGAVVNTGMIAMLTNSGTIMGLSGAYAVGNGGTIGVIANSGVISGAVFSTSALTFAGGTTTGTLAGGTIIAPSVEFASGRVILEDDIQGDTALTGATLIVAAGEQVDGQYRQSAGVLDIRAVGTWTVTGTASMTGGTVVAGGLSSTGNYLAGGLSEILIDAASGSSYSGIAIEFGSLAGLAGTVDVSSTDDLRVIYRNDYIGGTLPTLANTGSIGGGNYGVFVATGGSVGSFGNSGSIGGTTDAFYNGGSVGLLQNDGIIADGNGIDNAGLIQVLANSGLIEGDSGIRNTGTIGSLVNAGTITGPVFAIDNTGSLGPIANSGTISGNIRSTSALTIAGGAGSTYGVLRGGTITADVNFASGNLQLSDAIAGQAGNSGAVLQLASTITITGSYGQTAGTLDLGANMLTVSGVANFTGGTINASLSSGANYIAGQALTLIDAAAGSSYSAATINLTAIAGLSAAADSASTGDLSVSIRNDYIGGSLAALSNTGTISGSAYGVYVAAGGSLGALANSGVIGGTRYAIYSTGVLGTITNTGLISGNIASAGSLIFAGSGGTLAGGTITAAGVSIASGNMVLRDNVNVGTGTVTNSGAALELSSKITITGNYRQNGGGLISDVADASSYGSLLVSGSATISNATITLSGPSVRSGQTYTIVDAGSASSYTGDTLVLVGAHYRAELTTVGDDLVASIQAMFSEIGEAKGGSAAVMGGVLDQLSDRSAMQHSIDTLSLLSDEDLGHALTQAAPAEVGGGAAVLQRASLIEDLIGSAIGSRQARADGTGWSIWQQVLGATAGRDAVSGALGYDTTALGLVLGADNRLTENILVGGALSWGAGWNSGRGDVSGNGNGVNSLALTGYGGWSTGALTVNGRVAAGFDHYSQHRTMTYLDERAQAGYDGRHYVIAVEGGYGLPLAGNLTLTPELSLRWLRLEMDGYTETGASADGLTIGSEIADQLQSGLGAKLAWNIDTTFGLVVPEFRVAWLHDFVTGPSETHAVLSGLGFKTSSVRIAADGIKVGMGLMYHLSDTTSLRLEYGGQFRNDYAAHGGMLQVAIGL